MSDGLSISLHEWLLAGRLDIALLYKPLPSSDINSVSVLDEELLLFSRATGELIDAEVLRLIGDCHDEARRLLAEHRKELDALVAALLERETLDEDEILAVTGLPAAPALEEAVGKVSRAV